MSANPRPITFGIMVAQEHSTFQELREMWRLVEDLGFDSIWTNDHFVPDARPVPGPTFDSWTTVTHMLSLTQRVRGGVLVSGNTYRHPSLLAKIAATIDNLSDGRLIVGLGAGWHQQEHTAYGIPFYTTRDRLRMLDEACQVLHHLWRLGPGEHASFQGEYYSLSDAPFDPQPMQKPHPPLMVGGGGEKVTLRTVAQWADISNFTGTPIRQVAHKLDVLREHCQAVGRDYEDIEKSVGLALILTPDKSKTQAMAERLSQRTGRTVEDILSAYYLGTVEDMRELTQRYLDLGITMFVVPFVAPFRPDDLRQFADQVMRQFI